MSEKIIAKELEPAFNYPVETGDIYVYLMKTEVSKMAVITFDDTSLEWAYAVQSFTTNSRYQVDALVDKAARNYYDGGDEANPFVELEQDDEAMKKLYTIVAQFVKGE